MNLALKAQMETAYAYYKYEDLHFYSKIRENVDAINHFKRTFKQRKVPKAPERQMEEQHIKDILLCLFLWPVGLANLRKHKKNRLELERQANERFVAEMKAYEEFCDEIIHNIKCANAIIEQVEAQRLEFEKANSSKISFLYPNYRSLWHVEMLMGYICSGRADTQKEAINMMHEDLQRMEDRRIQREMFEESMAARERQHRETLASLDKIKESQYEASRQRNQMQQTLSQINYELRSY